MTYLDSAYMKSTVKLDDQKVVIHTTGYLDTRKPVSMWFGPLSLSMSTDQALKMAWELFRAVHHHRTATAETKAPGAADEGEAR